MAADKNPAESEPDPSSEPKAPARARMDVRPFLKWPGGKARLAPEIEKALGPWLGGRHYIEPFCGAMAVFFHRLSTGTLGDCRVVLADANPNLMILVNMVRDNVHALIEELGAFPRGTGWEDNYYAIREAFNADVLQGTTAMSMPIHSARMMWLNKCCFNGLWRENKRGLMNSPIGSYIRPSIPANQHLKNASLALQGTILRTGDFERSLELASEGDQVYCDPPYVPRSATSSFTSYTAGGFNWGDHVRLAKAAKAAVDRGARVVLSNHDVSIVRELYKDLGFDFGSLQVRRSISCKGSGRRERVGELLIWGGMTDRVAYPRH